YDTAISATLSAVRVEAGGFVRPAAPESPEGAAPLGERVDLPLEKIRDLRDGENPHPRAPRDPPSIARPRPPGARYDFSSATPGGLGAATVVQGKELSYTNLLDLDAAARIVLEFDEPAAAVIKHTNPCGVAIGESAAEAYVRARDADRLSSFGG